MNTMYDRISPNQRYSSQSSRDFGRDYGSTKSDDGEGATGLMLLYMSIGGSAVIFMFAFMLKAAFHG